MMPPLNALQRCSYLRSAECASVLWPKSFGARKSRVGRRWLPVPVTWKAQLPSRSIPTSTARSVWSLLAVNQELGEGVPLWVAPELSDPVGALEVGDIRTWSGSARGAGPSASRRSRSRRSSSSGDMVGGRLCLSSPKEFVPSEVLGLIRAAHGESVEVSADIEGEEVHVD